MADQLEAGVEPDILTMWGYEPQRMFRWRLELDCGCTPEEYTSDPDEPPLRTVEVPHQRRHLMPATRFCYHDHDQDERVYETVAEWDYFEIHDRPADPAQPPDYFDEDTWARVRKEARTEADWFGTLACGHEVTVTMPPDWRPTDGPILGEPRIITSEEIRVMTEVLGEAFAKHQVREAKLGFPKPSREHECRICPSVQNIVAYEPLGWLSPPEK